MWSYEEMKKMVEFHNFSLQKFRHEIFIAELKVLVLWWPSPAKTQYHTAWEPCGYVHDLANYRVLYQWQAAEMRLRPCPACPWNEYERHIERRPEADAA